MQTNLDDLISQAEAARIRNVSREAIYGLVSRGKLHVTEIGGQKFLRRSEVESYTPETGGRPPKAQTNGTAKPPAETTRKLNQAFREATEAKEVGKKATKKGSKMGAG